MKNVKRIILAVWAGSMVMAFQNCAQEMGGSLPPQKSSSSTSSSSLSCSGSDCNQTCSFDGAVLAVGESVTAYQTGSVSGGASCVSEARTCQEDGSLSGSYPFASCYNSGMSACLAAGNVTILDGSSRELYTSASVPSGQSCDSVKVNVSCNNGVLSNTNTLHASCTVEAAVSPSPNIKWVNIPQDDLLAPHNPVAVCATQNMYPSWDLGYGTCASALLRPLHGGDYDKINYSFGTFANGGTDYGGTHERGIFCYRQGETSKPDLSYNIAVAILCRKL